MRYHCIPLSFNFFSSSSIFLFPSYSAGSLRLDGGCSQTLDRRFKFWVANHNLQDVMYHIIWHTPFTRQLEYGLVTMWGEDVLG